MPLRIPGVQTAAVVLLLAATPAALPGQSAAPTLPVEAFVGRLQLAEQVGPGETDLAGIRLGVDLGAYTGIRGFYWRGFDGVPAQGYGAEAQVNLNVGNGVTPFLVGGVARLDFLDERGAVPPDDRTLPLVGGGLRLDLGRIGVLAAVRSYPARVESATVDGPRDLRHSPLWSVGTAFRLGRRGRPAAAGPTPPRVQVRVVRGDTMFVVERDTAAPEHFVSIPIPREGEIYLRYGPAGESRISGLPATAAAEPAMDEARLELLRRQIVADLEPVITRALGAERAELRDLVRREVAVAGLTPEAELRLLERIEAVVALRVRDVMVRAAAAGDAVPDAASAVEPPAPDAVAERFVPRLGAVRPYAGGNLDRPRQFVTGMRLDLGPFDAARPQVRLIPEAAIGIGQGGTSVMLVGNVAYEATPLVLGGTQVQPYGYGGLGFLFFGSGQTRRARREAVVNLGYGVVVPIPNHPAEFFLEHQGIDLFDLNRVLLGVRF